MIKINSRYIYTHSLLFNKNNLFGIKTILFKFLYIKMVFIYNILFLLILVLVLLFYS